MILIYSTFPNKRGAQRVGEGLVQKRLAACAVYFPINSVYWWNKKVVKDKEYAIIIKTEKKNFKKIEKFILTHHSYEVPCILEIPIKRVGGKYQKWLENIIAP